MSKFELNSYDVNGDGRIIIYQRGDVPNNKKWYCRVSVQGAKGLKRFSTKESDQRKAERYALERYQELYFKVKDGGSLQGKPFSDVYKEWCDYIDISKTNVTPLHRTSLKQRVRDTALKLFKNKPIDEITEGYELNVILGASKCLQSTRFVLAEVRHNHESFDGVYKMHEFISAMTDNGFVLTMILTAKPFIADLCFQPKLDL